MVSEKRYPGSQTCKKVRKDVKDRRVRLSCFCLFIGRKNYTLHFLQLDFKTPFWKFDRCNAYDKLATDFVVGLYVFNNTRNKFKTN